MHNNTGHLCSVGSNCLAVPRRQSFAALRLPAPISHYSDSSGQWPPSMQALVLCLVADNTCSCSRVVCRRRRTSSPRSRDVSRRGKGSPGTWASWPMAHTLARLRFAGTIAATVARFATGLGRLTLHRMGFTPAGRRTKFHAGIAISNPI